MYTQLHVLNEGDCNKAEPLCGSTALKLEVVFLLEIGD